MHVYVLRVTCDNLACDPCAGGGPQLPDDPPPPPADANMPIAQATQQEVQVMYIVPSVSEADGADSSSPLRKRYRTSAGSPTQNPDMLGAVPLPWPSATAIAGCLSGFEGIGFTQKSCDYSSRIHHICSQVYSCVSISISSYIV